MIPRYGGEYSIDPSFLVLKIWNSRICTCIKANQVYDFKDRALVRYFDLWNGIWYTKYQVSFPNAFLRVGGKSFVALSMLFL